MKDDVDGLWVAEAKGDIVGFALSWVCGDLVSGGNCSSHPVIKAAAPVTSCWREPLRTALSPSRSMSCRRVCIFGTGRFRGSQSMWSASHVTLMSRLQGDKLRCTASHLKLWCISPKIGRYEYGPIDLPFDHRSPP
jgi:hypothetical protein